MRALPQGLLGPPAQRGSRVEPRGGRAEQKRAPRAAQAVPGGEALSTKMGDARAEHAPEGLVDRAVAWGTLGAHVVAAKGSHSALEWGVVSVRSFRCERLVSATRAPPRRAAHPSARRSHAHTYEDPEAEETAACGASRAALPLPPSSSPSLTSCRHIPQPAPGCVAHAQNTQWALLVAGEAAPGRPAHGTRTARVSPQRPHGGRVLLATPPAHSLTTAWPTLRRTPPPETHAQTRAARTTWPAHLGPRPCIRWHSRPRTEQTRSSG